MNDLIERLRNPALYVFETHAALMNVAADEIERLTADCDNLRNTITSMQLSIAKQEVDDE